MVDLVAAVVGDLPDLFIGRMFSTVRSVLPDVRRNVRTIGQTLPIGSLLMSIDQRSEVRALVAQQMPILNEWGCFDRITPGRGGHGVRRRRPGSGPMGARRPQLDAGPPPGPVRHLIHLAAGKEFMAVSRTAGASSPPATTPCAPSTSRTLLARSWSDMAPPAQVA